MLLMSAHACISYPVFKDRIDDPGMTELLAK